MHIMNVSLVLHRPLNGAVMWVSTMGRASQVFTRINTQGVTQSISTAAPRARRSFIPARTSKWTQAQRPRYFHQTPHHRRIQPADDPNFSSIVDNPPQLVRAGQKHNKWGLMLLAVIPVTAFCLGTWQVRRLWWKTELLSRLEDRIARPPLPLPPEVDPDVAREFDYRRVYAVGRWRHDKEMLVGPRMMDGEQGYTVVTPLERPGRPASSPDSSSSERPTSESKTWTWWWPWSSPSKSPSSPDPEDRTTTSTRAGNTILVNRGWIAKKFRDQSTRPESLVAGDDVLVEGLLREPWRKNLFTPENRPDKGEFYFPDVDGMARLGGAVPVWVEETTDPDMLEFMDKKDKGIPIARAPVVDVRNNHAQYIFTWYGLCVATSIMFYLVVKKPPSDVTRRVRMNKGW